MSSLGNLKFVIAKQQLKINPIVQRRNKLSNKIFEQIQLAQAQKEGRSYAPTRSRTFTNKETGETRTVEVPKRLREWWHIVDNGKINLVIKYGSKQLQFDAKGKNAIEVGSGDELLAVLEKVRVAVEAGELDTHIEAASDALRAGFNK